MTCALITGSNCWTDAMADIAACRPARMTGQLAADGASCSLGDAAVTFHRNAEDTVPNWDFELLSGDGTRCVAAEVDHTAASYSARWTLTTTSGPVSYQVGEQVRLECPNGRTFEMHHDEWLLCGFAGVPGVPAGWSADGQHLIFTLRGSGTDLEVFDCVR